MFSKGELTLTKDDVFFRYHRKLSIENTRGRVIKQS